MTQDLYKLVLAIVFLFIFFLFSGGMYQYGEQYKYQLRVNKVTGTVEKNSNNGWIDVRDS